MSTTFSRTLLATVFGLSIATAPAVAMPLQQHGTQAQRAANDRAAADVRARIDTTEKRITEAQNGGAITPAQAAALRRQMAQPQASMVRLSRQQGFVSAAELASYNRTLGAIDIELDRRGVARGYGNDMLIASDTGRNDGDFKYDCENVPVRIAIPGDRLERSLNQLRLTTRCPISGTELARGKRSQPVVGTMTPTAALQAMLGGTGLQMRSIKGGFQVIRLPR